MAPGTTLLIVARLPESALLVEFARMREEVPAVPKFVMPDGKRIEAP